MNMLRSCKKSCQLINRTHWLRIHPQSSSLSCHSIHNLPQHVSRIASSRTLFLRHTEIYPPYRRCLCSHDSKPHFQESSTSFADVVVKVGEERKGTLSKSEKMERLVNRLLDEQKCPVGTLTGKDISAIDNAIFYYNQEVRSLNVHKATLSGYSTIEKSKRYRKNSERLLERALKEEASFRSAGKTDGKVKNLQKLVINKRLYSNVIETLAYSNEHTSLDSDGGRETAIRAEMWLQKLEEASSWKFNKHLAPNSTIFSNCILAWSRCNQVKESGSRAESLLRRMLRNKLEVNLVTYNRVISAWAKSGMKRKAASSAEALLHEIQESSGDNEELSPDRSTWHAVMETVARSEDSKSPESIEALIQGMISSGIEPNLSTYHFLLNSIAKSGRRDLSQKADKMLESILSEKHDFTPNTITFTLVLEILAKSGGKDRAFRASRILKQMLDYSLHNEEVKPNTYTFNVVIDAFSKSGIRNPEMALSAQNLLAQLEEMYEKSGSQDLKPSVYTFTSVLDAIANCSCRDSISNAMSVYDRVIDHISSGDPQFVESTMIHSAMINVLAKSNVKGSGNRAMIMFQNVRDNMSCSITTSLCNSVINALKNDFNTSTVDRIKSLIDWMEVEGKSGNFMPDSITYTSFISALANDKDVNSWDEIENVLAKMEKSPRTLPSSVTYAVVIGALSKKMDPAVPEMAEDIMERMEGLQNVQANTVCYTSLIKVWSNSMQHRQEEAQSKIDHYLERMWVLYKQGKPTKPNVVTYATVINSFSKSSNPQKAHIASQYLNDVINKYKDGDKYIKPNAFIFNAVIRICSTVKTSTSTQTEAYNIALETYKKMNNFADPNSYTYSTLLNACGNLESNDERFTQARMIFKDCCRRGLVDVEVLKRLRLCVSRAGLSEFLEGIYVPSSDDDESFDCLIQNLPREWTKNSVRRQQTIFDSRRELSQGRMRGRRLRKESLRS